MQSPLGPKVYPKSTPAMAKTDDTDGEKARVQELLATMRLMSKVSYNFKYQARAKEVLPNVICDWLMMIFIGTLFCNLLEDAMRLHLQTRLNA
jgi:hypothetical protein